MAKYCPVVGHRVVYLTCQECDDRVCERSTTSAAPSTPVKNESNNNENKTNDASAPREEPATECKADCARCCHMMSMQEEQIGPQKHMITRCQVYRNYLISYEKVKTQGCEHFNKDYSQEKICMNCSRYLGGGDWGLACSKHYHRLSTPLTEACESFDPRNK